MSTKSTPTRYGSVAIAIHWSSAIAVILTFAAGFVVANVAPPAQQTPILLAHITLGLIVFALTLLRIVWWAVADKHPPLPSNQPRAQRIAATVVHIGLYVLLILMASSGIFTLILLWRAADPPERRTGAGLLRARPARRPRHHEQAAARPLHRPCRRGALAPVHPARPPAGPDGRRAAA